MRRIVLRTFVVVVGFVVLLVAAQRLLTRDDRPAARLLLAAEGVAADGSPVRWEFTVCRGGSLFLDGQPSSLDALVERIASTPGKLTIVATGEEAEAPRRFERDGQGRTTLDGQPATPAQFRARLERFIQWEDITPTRPVNVRDVLAANLPPLTITKVSLPGFSYREAYPEATDEPELVIKSYRGHPMLDDPSLIPDKLKQYYSEKLPPVAERLPLNPAVVRGVDGIGKYSTRDNPMVWHRCAPDDHYLLYSKIGYPALIRFDNAGRLQPNLAWKWVVSDNNRVFTFYLRPGMKWSDGKPYTAEDILFACNMVAGSPAFDMVVPDWMQGTDGANMIYPEEVHDWARLAELIREQAASGRPSPGKQLWKVIDAEGRLRPLREMLEAIAPDRQPDEDAQLKLCAKLNAALASRAFYNPEAWRDVDFQSELEQLKKQGISRLSKLQVERYELLLQRADWLSKAQTIGDPEAWRPGDVTQFNVLVFRAAYRGLVEPARRERCRVESVPDANGDASHIVRFTFKKPNSIFLETTATFMCYWEMFTLQKAFLCRYHMDGYSKLDLCDILKWKVLIDSLERSAGAAGPSPGKHIWSLLSAEMKSKLAARRPAEDRAADLEYKGEIIAELNRALARRDFYDAESWAAADLESELARLLKDGYTALQQRERRRVTELLKRQDLLRRGVADLNDDELFAFNLAMLRAAFDGDPKLPDAKRDSGKIIAVNREDALDKLALWRGYRTWIVLWREVNRHKHGWNTHVPTMCPWRVVSEEDDMTIRGVRNPYYFKVDAQGQQLPYIDMVESEVVKRREIRLLKLQAGSSDFYERETEWADFTPLKQMEAPGGYEVRLWAMDYCGELNAFLCQQHADPEYRWLMGDSRFHQALSLAINRQEMIDIVWQGMGTPAQFSMPEGSKYYNPRLHHAYAEYDPERANRLLDELGLQKRAADGTRLFPSGRPVTLDVSTTDERPLAAVQLLCNYWRAVGLKPLMKVRLGDIIWRLSEMGKYDVWIHKEGGNYFGPLMAGYMVPTHAAESIQYSRWAVWLKTGGRDGEEPPERVKDLDRMWRKVKTAENEQAKIAAWMNLTDVVAEQLPVIGVTTSPGKVLCVKKNFKNVPRFALAGWIAHDPGNCNPEVFYIEQGP